MKANDLRLPTSSSSSRNVDDIMKTIADWKSKTHLNKFDDEDNDENNLRTTSNFSGGGNNYAGLGEYAKLSGGVGSGSSNRLYTSNGSGSRLTTLNGLGNSNGTGPESENSIKAEKYLDIVKDLKKRYTRSRTEVI